MVQFNIIQNLMPFSKFVFPAPLNVAHMFVCYVFKLQVLLILTNDFKCFWIAWKTTTNNQSSEPDFTARLDAVCLDCVKKNKRGWLSVNLKSVIVWQTGQMLNILGDTERLALMVGCLCHDLDHRGTNNQFQMKWGQNYRTDVFSVLCCCLHPSQVCLLPVLISV